MNFERAASVAVAVLYEGYILYPYGPSAIKNRQRWTFGGVFPKDHALNGGSDPYSMQTQCLLRGGPDTVVHVRVRFLHLVNREVGALAEPVADLPADREPSLRCVASLEVDGKRFLAWEEAVEREVVAPISSIAGLLAGVEVPFAFAGEREREPIRAADGGIAGILIRTGLGVQGTIAVRAECVADGVFRLTARIENTTPLALPERIERHLAQRRALVSTHTLLGAADGEFVSLLDPPEALHAAALRCDNQGTWPVLVGAAGERDLLLSSPIILYDYPQVAPESPGDLFDATEIDEILTLRILTMTDEEKRDMAAVDARARALLERTEVLTPAEFDKLHGVLRQPGPGPERGAGPRLAALAADGVSLQVGDRVRLCPRANADIMDIVLKGEVAIIEAIERDFEDRVHLAVTLLDDPGRDFGLERMPGHRFFFSPDEVERLEPGAAT